MVEDGTEDTADGAGVADELDATYYNPEDILASAAKKAKKKDLAAVGHSRLKCESFRKILCAAARHRSNVGRRCGPVEPRARRHQDTWCRLPKAGDKWSMPCSQIGELRYYHNPRYVANDFWYFSLDVIQRLAPTAVTNSRAAYAAIMSGRDVIGISQRDRIWQNYRIPVTSFPSYNGPTAVGGPCYCHDPTQRISNLDTRRECKPS